MKKLIEFRYRKTSDLGFSTLEVLVSIIIALAFVSVAMQSFVLGMAMKVQAQEKQRANQLIQEDLELLSFVAANVTEDHDNKCSPAAYADGYAKDLWNDLQTEKADGDSSLSLKLLKNADGTEVGKTISLTREEVSDGSSDSPHRTLKINYEVKDSDDNVIAERYVEVIPDVALRCP